MKLLPFQIEPASHLQRIVESGRTVSINASETGTGKTYMGLHLVKELDRPTLILCPKATVPNWERLATGPILDITNIEKLKTGNRKWLTRHKKLDYTWNLPKNSIVLVDEAHQYSGQSSQNAYALAYLKTRPDIHVHLMSATLADSPAKFRMIGFLLGLHDFVHFTPWAIEHGCFVDVYGNLRFTKNPGGLPSHPMMELHHKIFPEYGIRLRTSEIEGFPRNLLTTVLASYTGTPRYLKEVAAYMAALTSEEVVKMGDWADMPANQKSKENPMVELLRSRQESELLKLPFLRDQVLDTLEEGHSAVVFLNFKYSIRVLQELLKVPCLLIHGDRTDAECEEAKEQFQKNQGPIILCTHGRGGTGIDLHDLQGRPRRSLVSPCFSTVQFQQTLGRIHRAGSLSPAIQTIVCQKATAEEMVLKTLDRKLKDLSKLNDGDLQL